MNSPQFRPRLGLAVLLAFVALALLQGQEVSITPFEWANPRGAPDELPTFKKPVAIKFPSELRATPDLGYVVIEVILDSQGRRLAFHRHWTLEILGRASELPDVAFTPGRRDGAAVVADVTFGVLFNPATASPQAADASPRLLEVSLVHLPAPKDAATAPPIEDRVVFADLSIDETGAVSAVKNAPEELATQLSNTTKLWKFAPARRGGQPVAAELRAPFIVVTGAPRLSGKGIVPKATFQARPVYPVAMVRSGMRGEVVVDFIVDIEGRVRNAYVVRSLNPAFDDPAIESVQKWRFEPGQVGGVPVNTHMQVPIIFQLDNTASGGANGLVLNKKGDPSKLPEEFRYDTEPRLTGTARPIYPYALLNAGKEGKARVAYVLGENGRVTEAKVVEATAPEFGQALLAAVEQFTYEPALKAGRPSKALLSYTGEFKRDENFQVVATADLDLLRREQKKPQTIITLAEIDGKIVPRSRRPPRYPLSHLKDAQSGEAQVEFLIDEDGRARLPRIVSATDDAFGYAAVQSVADWRFEPPTRGGKPATVRARIPILFQRPTAPAVPEGK